MDPDRASERGTEPGDERMAAPSARDEAGTWFSRGVGFVGGGLLAYGVVNGFLAASSVVLILRRPSRARSCRRASPS